MRFAEIMDKNSRMLGLRDKIFDLVDTARIIRKRRQWRKVARLQKLAMQAGEKAAGP